ncbi:hypothetical protein NY929_20190 [Escherichia coli]|nr:hypothetical protein [Escherichia coli]MDA4461257.1 hypothetical protein [Escherichia coli]
MLDHVKVLIGEAHLVEAVHSILKTNVMNVVIEDIMLVIVDVLKEDDAGHTLLLGLVHDHTAVVLVLVQDLLHVPVQGLY